ncbi:MAG: hypothetical protein MUO76_14075, partial [Anaerolineaceae bacterium]|nr:hypothetical protein [Anaerolineaceae bacterium]
GEEVGCISCHSEHDGYPHPENPAEDIRDYVLGYRDTCKKCHDDLCEEHTDCVHNVALDAGNRNAAICADCHTPHSQGRVTDDEGNLLRTIKREIPPTCAKCHNAIFEEYSQSVHGAGLFGGNPDVPTCIDCHQLHVIVNPEEPSFRLDSVHYCSKCHTDKDLMKKYDISTNVESTYIADFHGTTITLFEYDDPNEPTNKPVCFDCHGYHDVLSADDPEKGIHVKSNLLMTCQRCHPDAEENFPESWLSHYIPDTENYPLVFYVKLFYKFFIPTVLGGMGVFVVSDIYKRFLRRKDDTII